MINSQNQDLGVIVLAADNSLEEVIISGNLKPVNRMESTIPVEVYSPAFLQQNPSPNLFEGIHHQWYVARKLILRFVIQRYSHQWPRRPLYFCFN